MGASPAFASRRDEQVMSELTAHLASWHALEAHLGDFAQAQQDLTRYLALAPKAKDEKQVQGLQNRQETALREPIAPAALVGVWWPDATAPDREKFFRLEFALLDGRLMARVLPQAGWEQAYPASHAHPCFPSRLAGWVCPQLRTRLPISLISFVTCREAWIFARAREPRPTIFSCLRKLKEGLPIPSK